jgi:hypothetical protein
MSAEPRTAEAVSRDIKENPQKHLHNFDALQACCTINGAIDPRLMEAHTSVTRRTNGGRQCDVSSGPCSCGAWH